MAADPLELKFDACHRKHDLRGALAASTEIIARDGRVPRHLARHAGLHRSLNEFPECGAIIDELSPLDFALADTVRAEWLLDRGAYDQALKQAEALRTRTPNDRTAFVVRARVLRIRKQLESAADVVRQALREHPNDVELRAEHAAILAHREYAKRDVVTAWNMLPPLLEHFNATALGVLSTIDGRNDDVVAAFDKLLRISPNDFLVLTHYAGFRLNVCDQPDVALKLIEDTLAENPRMQLAWLRKMDALQFLGRQEEVAKAAEDAIAAVPMGVRLQVNLLNDLRVAGELARVEELLAQFQKEHPDSLDFLEAKIDLLRRQGRVREALALAAQAETAVEHAQLQRTIATTYYEARQYDNARRVLGSANSSKVVWSDRILCEIAEGTYRRALRIANQAAEEFPTSAAILGLKAWLLAHQGEFIDAYELLQRASVAEPANSYPVIVRAEVELMQCKFKEAKETTEAMRKKYPVRSDLLHSDCEIALHEGDTNRVIALADQMLKADASRTTAMQIRAMALALANRRDEAIEYLDEAIHRFGYSAGLRACRGYLRLEEDDVHGAREDFDWAIDSSPDGAVLAKTGMGTIAYRERRHADARYWFKRAVDVQPASVEALANLAWSYAVGSTAQELEAAEKYAADSRRIVRDHPRTLAVLAVVAFKRGERGKALRLMTAAAAGRHQPLDLAVNLAAMQRITGKLAEAEKTIRAVLEKDPQHARARIELAALFLKLRKNEDARATAESAVDENPSSGAGWRILAATHVAAGDMTAAEAVLRRAMAECDEIELPDIRIDLSRILLNSATSSTRDARLREAREHLAAALEVVEDHPEALLLRAWSDLKLERPSLALRALDRIRGRRLRGYAQSLRQAAIEQRLSTATASGPALQWILATAILLQLVLVWVLRFNNREFAKGAEFGTLVSLLCGLFLLTILLPRLIGFKFGSVVEAELTKPPSATSADAFVTPLSDFEMQPSLTPVIGVLAYDT